MSANKANKKKSVGAAPKSILRHAGDPAPATKNITFGHGVKDSAPEAAPTATDALPPPMPPATPHPPGPIDPAYIRDEVDLLHAGVIDKTGHSTYAQVPPANSKPTKKR